MMLFISEEDSNNNAAQISRRNDNVDNLSNHKYSNFERTSSTSTTVKPAAYETQASEKDYSVYYNQQQIDRLGHEYEYYDDDEDEYNSKEEESEKNPQEYEYYYVYEYVDPDKLQFEKLPQPSFRVNSSPDEKNPVQ